MAADPCQALTRQTLTRQTLTQQALTRQALTRQTLTLGDCSRRRWRARRFPACRRRIRDVKLTRSEFFADLGYLTAKNVGDSHKVARNYGSCATANWTFL
jgi:hypothetical protein